MAGRATPDGASGHVRPLDTLLVAAGGGDAAAFAELYDRLAPRVFGTVTSLVGDPVTAERVSCEAFVEVWRRASTYDPAASGAAAWVLGIVRRIAVPEGRLSPREGDRPSDEPPHETALLAAGLTRAQAGAVRLAWCEGLDHRAIDAELRTGGAATSLITEGLRALATAGGR